MRRLVSIILLALLGTVLYAQELPSNMNSLGKKLIDAIDDENFQEADILADRYLELCTSDKYRYGRYYAEAKHVKAHMAAANGDYALALQIMYEVLASRLDERTPRNSDRIGDSYFDRGEYNFRVKFIDSAIADMQAAAEAYLKADESDKYAAALCQLAYYYHRRGAPGDGTFEAECYEKAFPFAAPGTSDYLSAASWKMRRYNELGQQSKALKLEKQLRKTAVKVSKKEPVRYADFLLSASVAEAKSKQYAQALADAKEAISIYEETQTVNLNYATSLKTAADGLFYLEQNEKADSLYEKARPLLLKIEGVHGQVYQGCLRQLIATNDRLGRLEKVATYKQELETLLAGVRDTTTREYANMLATQAQLQADMGNYAEAAAISQRAMRRYQARGDTRQQLLMLNAMSRYYTHLGKRELADSLNALSLQLSHNKRGFAEEEALALHQKATSLYRKGDYALADEECQHALSMLREANFSKSTIFASILSTRAAIQDRLKNYQTAIDLTRNALDIQTSILGTEHGKNVKLYDNLAVYHYKLGQMDSVAYYYHRAITLQTELVRNNFSFQSTWQREQFWQRESYLYQRAPLLASVPEKASPGLLTDIYNAQLFTKGILLNSEIDFRRTLQQSADKEVLAKYDELMTKRAELQQCYEATSGGTMSKIDQLKHDIAQLEDYIVRQCKEYGDFTQNLKLTTDSLRHALRADEAAVEFLETDLIYGGKPDRLYIALILRPEWSAPRACQLFWRSEIAEQGYPAGTPFSQLLNDTTYQNRIYNDSNLGKLVWKNLISQLDGATHIYFAPTGLFYQWGIEYMPITDTGTRISDTLSVSRLSSTKLLAQRTNNHEAFGNGEAVIYGGLGYDMGKDEIRKYKDGKVEIYETYTDLVPEDFITEEDPSFMLAAAESRSADSLTIQNMVKKGNIRFGRLKGANEEAEDIERLLRQAGVKAKRYAAYGTEGSFKALSGTNISLLHIATHGFSLNPSATTAKQEDPLSNSGLLFAGCNYKLQHANDFPPGIDDGILTAQEIALLNLQNLQLTVLSACQTGLGELREDGVFGVQRGFKKAGAHTLVMSLWSVDDFATRHMMTSFYEALISGLSRHDAFLKAQAAVREAYPDPHYWAPFIMLDDI